MGGKDLFRLLQSFGQQRIVARLDAFPADGAAAERYVGNAHLLCQSGDRLHVEHLVLQRVRVDKIGAHTDAHHAGAVAGQHVFEHLDVRAVFGQVPLQHLDVSEACTCDRFQRRLVVAKGQVPDVLNACNAAPVPYQRTERVCHVSEFHVCSFLVFINLRKFYFASIILRAAPLVNSSQRF